MKKKSIFIKVYFAFCIDGTYSLVIGAALMVIIAIYSEIVDPGIGRAFWELLDTTNGIAMYYFFTISANATIQEILFGTTLGKRVFGLVVVNEKLQKPKKRQIVLRNVVYPLDTFLVIGSIPLLMEDGRSLGDCISETRLVYKDSLEDI